MTPTPERQGDLYIYGDDETTQYLSVLIGCKAISCEPNGLACYFSTRKEKIAYVYTVPFRVVDKLVELGFVRLGEGDDYNKLTVTAAGNKLIDRMRKKGTKTKIGA